MDLLQSMFDRQYELTVAFHAIEENNFALDDSSIPASLETIHGQKQVRATLAYLLDEIGEFMNASTKERRKEELVDVLHFTIELFILSGTNMTRIDPRGITKTGLLEKAFNVVILAQFMSDTANTTMQFVRGPIDLLHELKSKPWKKQLKPFDRDSFERQLCVMFHTLLAMAHHYDFTAESLHAAYFDKATINSQRVKDGV